MSQFVLLHNSAVLDREKLFKGVGCVTEFGEWLFEHCEQNTEPLIVIAHNLGGYDVFFILEWIVDNRSKLPEILFDGARVNTMTLFNLSFKDSYNNNSTVQPPQPF